jgi:hypothetical protein
VHVLTWSRGILASTLLTCMLFLLLYRLASEPLSLVQLFTGPTRGPSDLWGRIVVVSAFAIVLSWGVFWLGAALLDLAGRVQGKPARFTWWHWLAGVAVAGLALALAGQCLATR